MSSVSVEIIHADCLDALPRLAADGFRAHAVVTDPPAGIGFMGCEWDSDKGGRDYWIAWMQQVAAETLRCVRPGAHALVWALPRTSHWTATAWENAGWTVRDRVSHLFGTGFPKSLDVSKAIDRAAGVEREVVGARRTNKGDTGGQTYAALGEFNQSAYVDITAPATPEAAAWAGWGTALKPAVEDWWLFRKPLSEGSVAANVLRHGTGAINVDACRVPMSAGDAEIIANMGGFGRQTYQREVGVSLNLSVNPMPCKDASPHTSGRWPANLLHDGSPEVEQAFAAFGERSSGTRAAGNYRGMGYHGAGGWDMPALEGNSGSASRFFFTAKADANDRQGSRHPTVKPASLMRWLVRLVTPPGGTILDPFAGTGSTGLAADQLGMDAVLIERDAQYAADARRKIERDGGLFADVREPCQMAAQTAMRDLFADAAD